VELETSLIEVVRIGVEEGCVGETLGAALAARALEVATDPEVVAVVRRIALDEARHAELAWRFLRWAIVVGGPAAREAARRGMERATSAALAMKVERYDDAIGDWHAHGRLTCEESRALSAEVIAEVIRPCLEVALAPGRTAASGHASSPGLPASSSRPWAG
jgi:hypothetical protein